MSNAAETKAIGSHSATLHISASEGSGEVQIRLTFDTPPDVLNPAKAHHLACLAYQAITDFCGPAYDVRRVRHH